MTHLPTKLHKMICLRKKWTNSEITENKNPEIIVSIITQDMSPYIFWYIFYGLHIPIKLKWSKAIIFFFDPKLFDTPIMVHDVGVLALFCHGLVN